MTPEQLQQVADLTKLEIADTLLGEVDPAGVISEHDHQRLIVALSAWRDRQAARVAAGLDDAGGEEEE